MNRRNLRIKAMQTLFAYNQCRVSNKENAWADLLQTVFPPIVIELLPEEEAPAEPTPEEPAAEEVADEPQEEPVVRDPDPITEPETLSPEETKKRRLLREALYAQMEPDPVALPDEVSSDTAATIAELSIAYHKQLAQDLKHLRKHMLKEVEGVHELYLWVLGLPLALREHESQVVSRKTLSPNKVVPRFLMGNNGLELLEKRLKGVSSPTWDPHTDRLSQWYKEVKQHEGLAQAMEHQENGLEEDVKQLRFIFKSVLWKSQSFQDFFEEHDMGWHENKDIIKSLVNKTLKSISDQGVDLAPLSYQWEDDKKFFEEIFDSTVELEDWAEKLIAAHAKNWDMERIAQLDMVLLKMALCEMIKFPSIPVKVTINEYIEISKRYSTPKSKKFINGILDVLASELMADGTIKKSGRGLIDNR